VRKFRQVVCCVCELCDIRWFYCGDVSAEVVCCVCELCDISWFYCEDVSAGCVLCMWIVWLKLVLLWGRFGRSCMLGMWINCRSQWPRGIRRRSAVVRLLRSWVPIPPVAWMFVVSVGCCQVEVSATSWSLVQRSPTDCDVSLNVI
jgi:hypothetical protein